MTSSGPLATAANSHDTPTDAELPGLLDAIEALADRHGNDPEALLNLLRRLEGLHRSIQEGPFRASLPEDRQRLFDLLQNMERSGGWPYIPRLQLRTFMELFQKESGDDARSQG